MPKINPYQVYPIVGSGGVVSFPVTENTIDYYLIPATSPLALVGNLTISPSGTEVDGMSYVFHLKNGIVYDGGVITIFGYELAVSQAYFGCTVTCRYISGNWVVEALFSAKTGIGQTINGVYITDGTLDGNSLKSADVPLSKLVVAAARGYALRAGVGGAPEYFNAITAGQVLMGSGTDVVSLAISGAFSLNGAGVATLANNYVTKAMLAYTPIEYYEADLNITSAEILTLNGSPLTIVANPGAGKYIEAISASAQMLSFGASAYATNTTLQLINTGADVAQLQDTAILISTVNKTTKFKDVTSATAGQTQVLPNTALQVKVGTGNPITGDSAIKVSVIYRIVTI